MKDLAKAYPQLSADERFRLFMQAVARDDGQEQDRLNNTCPQKTYRCDDIGYTRRKMHFMFLALWHCQDLRRIETAANLALVVALALQPEDDVWAAKSDVLMLGYQNLMRNRASKVVAWERFCGSLGLPVELPKALGGTAEFATALQTTTDVAAGICECDPDPELIDTQSAVLHAYWRDLLSGWN